MLAIYVICAVFLFMLILLGLAMILAFALGSIIALKDWIINKIKSRKHKF